MRVIGAGLPRTATMTQKMALERLGFGPCYHGTTLITDGNLIPLWKAALEGKPDWETIFRGYQATVDDPGAFFYRELAEAYPDAKVLLSVRDGRSWARSLRDTIWNLWHGDTINCHLLSALATVYPVVAEYRDLISELHEKSRLLGPDPAIFDEDAVIEGMERHNAEVRAAIAPERLLEWSPEDGWEPLCAFLNVPVPAEPLPRSNDSAGYNEMFTDGFLQALTDWRSAQRVNA